MARNNLQRVYRDTMLHGIYGAPKIAQQKVCNDCQEEVGTNFKIYCGRKYCEDCYLNVREKCALCGKEEKDKREFFPARVEEDGMKLIMVCVQCSSKLQACEHGGKCDIFFKKDEGRKCEECERYLCKFHKFDHSCKTEEPTFLFRRAATNHYNGSVKLAKEIKIPWLIGVELEAVNGEPKTLGNKLDGKIGISHDGSLKGRNPIEMQLPPSSNDRLERFIKHVSRVSRNAGYKVNKSCGMHIHLDATGYRQDIRFISRLLSTYYAIEPVIFEMLPKSRRNNKYALPLRNWINEARMLELTRKPLPSMEHLQMLWYKARDLDQSNRYRNGKYDSSRYHGFNLHALFTIGTIEMRYHHGTLNRRKITNWINFHLMIFDWVKNNFDQNVVDAIFFCENPKDKFRLMCRHFKFPKTIRRYVLRNIRKFADNDLEDKD